MFVVLLGLALGPAAAQACTSDVECKGTRICVAGSCTSPEPPCSRNADCNTGFSCKQSRCIERQGDLPAKYRLRRGSSVLILPFRDHQSEDPNDSLDTGRFAQESFFEAFDRINGMRVVLRPPSSHSARFGWTREEAATFAVRYKVEFVVYGEVTDFYRVAPFTYRNDRAGVWVEMVTATGKVFFRQERTLDLGTNHIEPEAVLDRIAKTMVKEIRPDRGKR